VNEQQKINYLISTIRNNQYDKEDYLVACCDIICQFDTDIAIKVMEGLVDSFGKDAKYQAMAIKVNYGY
jgi:hypothetical protein